MWPGGRGKGQSRTICTWIGALNRLQQTKDSLTRIPRQSELRVWARWWCRWKLEREETNRSSATARRHAYRYLLSEPTAACGVQYYNLAVCDSIKGAYGTAQHSATNIQCSSVDLVKHSLVIATSCIAVVAASAVYTLLRHRRACVKGAPSTNTTASLSDWVDNLSRVGVLYGGSSAVHKSYFIEVTEVHRTKERRRVVGRPHVRHRISPCVCAWDGWSRPAHSDHVKRQRSRARRRVDGTAEFR
jgi:hypothetical protein